jgi:hypothetical protein
VAVAVGLLQLELEVLAAVVMEALQLPALPQAEL